MALEEGELRTCFGASRTRLLFPIVAVAAFTGARRNEILALRWTDLETLVNKNPAIERAVKQVRKQPLTVKEPKNRARQAHHHDRRWPDRDTFSARAGSVTFGLAWPNTQWQRDRSVPDQAA